MNPTYTPTAADDTQRQLYDARLARADRLAEALAILDEVADAWTGLEQWDEFGLWSAISNVRGFYRRAADELANTPSTSQAAPENGEAA